MSLHLVPHLPGLVGWERRTTASHRQTLYKFVHRFLCNFNDIFVLMTIVMHFLYSIYCYLLGYHCIVYFSDDEKKIADLQASLQDSKAAHSNLNQQFCVVQQGLSDLLADNATLEMVCL